MTSKSTLTQLKATLQKEKKATKLENLAAALLGRLLGVTFGVAKSGFQYGGDTGPAGRQGRRLRVECKKYRDTTPLSDRELLGEIDQALSRDDSLEAWILVTTREAPEQLEQSLHQKGEEIGLPVIILDWKSGEFPSLAALCAFAPDLVESEFSSEAGELARVLQPFSAEAVERIRRDLQSWSLGFELLRLKSLEKLDKIWSNPRESNAAFVQNAAGGAENKKIQRQAILSALDKWWNELAKEDAPTAVVGWDGVGKTWATLNWLVERSEAMPVVLVVPSSSAAELSGASETVVKNFLANRLYELTGVRDRKHWLRRLDNLLKRPLNEGPVLTIFFDGLNQEPSVPWLPVLKVLQGESFAGHVRVIVSTRTHHYENKLAKLQGLVVPAVLVPVDIYDISPGGEFDQMLFFEGLTRSDLHPDIIDLARTPRLFKLVVKFRERLGDAGKVTIHRLLWEYGRDSLGSRAGRSFSEDEWREWLQEIAQFHREGVREFSIKTLSETTSRPDLSNNEVYARLSDIIDGQFMSPSPSGKLQIEPRIVAHALGAALLSELDINSTAEFDTISVELTQWLDPIAGLDLRSEILRAAVSILIERGLSNAPITGVLVTAWLQTQNVTDNHRLELSQLAASLVNALLDAIEHSQSHPHASARLWSVNALRAIDRQNLSALSEIVARARQWLSVVSRDFRDRGGVSPDIEKSRSSYLLERIGRDASGQFRVLGLDLQLVDWDSGSLAAVVPSLLEGFPLANAIPAFEAAAIALSVGRRNKGWAGLKWLCLLNEIDPVETVAALRSMSDTFTNYIPEIGVNAMLPTRVAALLLWLTGEEGDDAAAVKINPSLDHPFTYEKDYLPNPSKSYFPLERRHAEVTLKDPSLPLLSRIQRTRELWFDNNFIPPLTFVDEVREFAAQIEVEKLNRHSSKTIEDHHFEEFEPVLARCAPDLLTDLIRRNLRSFQTCPPESRYWCAIQATDNLFLASEAESAAARVLRLSARENVDNNESYAVNQLLTLELLHQTAPIQAATIIEAEPKYISEDLGEVLQPLDPHEVDTLIARFGKGSTSQRRNLLIILLSQERITYNDAAWSWIIGVAFGDDVELHRIAYPVLTKSDAARFGHDLFMRDWTWSASADYWTNHYGTGALIEATTTLTFDQIAPRLAPWRLIEAVRQRGGDPSEIRMAAEIFSSIIVSDRVEEPDLGSLISVDLTEDLAGPFRISVTPRQLEVEPDNLQAMFKAQMDTEGRLESRKRATVTAIKRIGEARESGASLYLANVTMVDLEIILTHASDLVEIWLEGSSELTGNFRQRTQLADATYLALCEALLKHDPVRGVMLWRSLNQVIATRYTGTAEITELLHIAFRAPDTAPVKELREELIGLNRCHTDKDLLNLAIAATFNGKAAWLSSIIKEDQNSPLTWRRKRGIILEGFTSKNSIPIDNAWPDAEIRTNHERLQHKSARSRYKEACAHHWWNIYLNSADDNQAYAAWVMFLRSVDRRAWVWIRSEVQAAENSSNSLQLKIRHAWLNQSKMKRAMEKNEKKLDEHFLDREVVNSLGPWAKESAN